LSTKIHNGFVFDTADLFKIHSYIKKFARELGPLIRDQYGEMLYHKAVYRIDELLINKKVEQYKNPLSAASREFRDRVEKIRVNRMRDPEIDFEFNITFYPLAKKKKVLGLVSCEQQEWVDLWMDKPFVTGYNYWNNIDKPDDIPTREWNTRKRDWDKVLRQDHVDGTLTNGGFTYECVHEAFRYACYPKRDKVNRAWIPTRSQRANRLAKDDLFKDYRRIKRISLKKQPFSHYMDYLNWINKDTKGKKLLKQRVQELKAKLEKITVTTLYGK